jgi:ABC-2 type transport system ATP-binding protein
MMRDAPDFAKYLAVHSDGLTKRYGDTLAVDRLDLDIVTGEFFGLLGPNGSGKTTTIHMLSTLVRPTSGKAVVAGHDIGRSGVKVRGAIGVVFQDSALDRTLSVWENLRFAGMLAGLPGPVIRERADELLDLFGLADKRNKPVGSLSGGMRRAVDIARGVIHRPQLLFLDEPTIGLDLPNRKKIWRFIERLRAQTGMTVLLTTHYLEEAADCNRVAFIKQGRIVKSGAPQTLIDNLCENVIEIEGDKLDDIVNELKADLGDPLLEEERASFRFSGSQVDLAILQADLAQRVPALRVRRPNLNDVFLWVSETDVPSRRPGERGVESAR